MIEIKNITKNFSKDSPPILDNISYRFSNKGLYYIVGKSGCGKSTLLHIIGGIDYNYNGDVFLLDKKVKSFDEQERANYLFSTCSFSFQDYKIDDKKKVYSLLKNALEISTLSDKEIRERIDKYLCKVGLFEKRESLFSSLSGGEKKRISLVRALIRDNPVLLIDEPISSLNKKLRKEITSLLIEESKSRLIIVITHEKKEIPQDAFVLSLENGRLSEINKGNLSSEKEMKTHYERKNYSGINFFKNIIQSLLLKKEYFALALTSLSIALFTITLSFMLVFNVSSSLLGSLLSYMEEDSLVIRKKENEEVESYYSLPEKEEIEKLKQDLGDTIISTDEFYVTNIDSIISEYQQFSFVFNNKSLYIENFSLSTFLECYKLEEKKENDQLFFHSKEMKLDEIIIGIDEKKFKSLYYLITGEKIKNYENEYGKHLLELIEANTLSFRIEARKISWKYNLDYSYKIVGFVFSDYNYVMSNNHSFTSSFVKNTLGFKERFIGEDTFQDYPALLEKAYGITINPKKKEEFIIRYLNSKFSDHLSIQNFSSQQYFVKNNYETYNRFLVYKDYLNKLSLSDINRFVSDNKEKISSIDYSTAAYTYTTSGYISGFTKPFFFSKYKNKLIEIEGEYTFAEDNLGQMQASTIQVEKDVFKGDLLSSIDKSGIVFVSFDRNKDNLKYGQKPSIYNEIAISSSFAKKLNKQEEQVLGMTLHTLLLEKTSVIGNKYQNEFSFGELTICGIYENDNLNIYHESLFPFAYLFSHSVIEPSQIHVNEVILKVDIENYSEDYYLEEIKRYGDYKGSFPMLIISKQMQKTLANLTILFSILAGISLLISSFLITLNLFLIIEKDKKEIGILLSLGYTKKEIRKFYIFLTLMIGAISYLSSLVISIFAQKTIFEQLSLILNHFSFSFVPYLISLIVGLLLSLIIGTIATTKIKNIDIKEAFDKF